MGRCAITQLLRGTAVAVSSPTVSSKPEGIQGRCLELRGPPMTAQRHGNKCAPLLRIALMSRVADSVLASEAALDVAVSL